MKIKPPTPDYEKDKLLTKFGPEILKDRYMLPEEKSPQDAFVRAAAAFAEAAVVGQR